jgi:hypothetical protein
MSSTSITTSQPDNLRNSTLLLSDSNQMGVQSDFWKERSIQNAYFGMTTSEITRLVLRVIAFSSFCTAGSIVGLTAMGVVVWQPLTSLVIPSFLGAIGMFLLSMSLDNHEVPVELERYRRDALKTSLNDVAQSYGWTQLLQWGVFTPDQFVYKYREQLQGKNLMEVINYYEKVSALIAQALNPRFHYQPPSPRDWKEQWRQETSTLKFEQIIQTYSLEQLEKYNILEVEELNHLKTLKQDLDGLKNWHAQQITTVNQDFEVNTAAARSIYDRACAAADEAYNTHSSVQSLGKFDLNFISERAVIQSRLSQCKTEANEDFNKSIAALPKKSYSRLTTADKKNYDKLQAVLGFAESQAEHEARVKHEELDRRNQIEKQHLQELESLARSGREQKKAEAKAIFDQAIASQEANENKRIAPINDALQSAIEDLNCRYRSYLDRGIA